MTLNTFADHSYSSTFLYFGINSSTSVELPDISRVFHQTSEFPACGILVVNSHQFTPTFYEEHNKHCITALDISSTHSAIDNGLLTQPK